MHVTACVLYAPPHRTACVTRGARDVHWVCSRSLCASQSASGMCAGVSGVERKSRLSQLRQYVLRERSVIVVQRAECSWFPRYGHSCISVERHTSHTASG